jgi:hypothetical protein
LMRAKTHPGDEKHIETSSSGETMDVEEMKQPGIDEHSEADEKLRHGLSVDDIAEQSAYEDNSTSIAHQAANSDRNKK